ncbi:MAG: phosphatase PAP2 family protein [Gammaproteobacteria bacterium]|nr:phosphatase PAP2 family protein [Gammaproteobacteria bacterium]
MGKRPALRCAQLAGAVALLAGGLARADAVSGCPANELSAQPYLQLSTIQLVGLVAPPPVAGSPAARRDLEGVLEAQREARRRGTVAHAIGDSQLSCLRVADVLGAGLNATRAPLAVYFLNRAALSGASASGPGKTYWWRPRPYVVSTRVRALADVAPGATEGPGPFEDFRAVCGAQPPRAPRRIADLDLMRAHTSYPSGHAAFGTTCAILLAGMVPEQRAALFQRSRDYARSRNIVGAHFPSDLEAGFIVATVAVAQMQQDAGFRRDFERARIELRAALGLPADPPDLTPPRPMPPASR